MLPIEAVLLSMVFQESISLMKFHFSLKHVHHNYKTFNACSMTTHWQHLISFKIKTIFLYEFQLLAS